MILSNIFISGFLGLAFTASQASAQVYQHHHQQYMFRTGPGNVEDHPKVHDVKASTPVEERFGDVKVDWAYVATVSNSTNPDERNALLVKLRDNQPINNIPFLLEFAVEYFDDRASEGKRLSIDVEDVVYYQKNKNKKEYILCGAVKNLKKGTSEGFLMQVKKNGNIQKAKRYPDISVLKSCTPNKKYNRFVAVGLTQFPDLKTGRDGVYLQVKNNLKPDCSAIIKGVFNPSGIPPPDKDIPEPDEEPNRRKLQPGGPPDPDIWPPQSPLIIESGLSKVIQYDVPSKAGTGAFAFTGTTTALSKGFRDNSDVLVGIASDKCVIDWVKQFGSKYNYKETEISETGLSIAQLSKNPPNWGVVVTGNTKAILQNEFVRFDDTLVFRVDNWGNLIQMNHYDVEMKDRSDFGTSVQLSSGPANFFGEDNPTILVGGEAITEEFASLESTTKDAFLLEISQQSTLAIVDLFGIFKDRDQGALDGGNLDFHLSQDDHAVLMGNTEKNFNDSKRYPLIIERYWNPADICQDQRRPVQPRKYEFLDNFLEYVVKKQPSRPLKLKSNKLKYANKSVCYKIEVPDLTDEPTESPTEVPSASPTKQPVFTKFPIAILPTDKFVLEDP